MIVKIDKRETARVCQAAQYYMPKFKIIIEELEIGDFIFSENHEEVVFEYKTLYDFMWSIVEGRLFDQAIRQKQNFKYHHVIIEWSDSGRNKANKQLKKMGKELSLGDIYESIAILNTMTTVLISPNVNISFPLMEKYAKICLEKKPFEKIPKNKSNNVAFNFLMLIEGINKVKANRICKRLKLKTVRDLTCLTTKKLIKVPGIGPVTAERIMASIK